MAAEFLGEAPEKEEDDEMVPFLTLGVDLQRLGEELLWFLGTQRFLSEQEFNPLELRQLQIAGSCAFRDGRLLRAPDR